MSSRVRILSAIAGLAMVTAVVLAIVFGPSSTPEQDLAAASANSKNSAVAAGKVAPNFNLVGLDGKSLELSSLRGKVVFLNVWATWCPPCRTEMPSIQALYRDFQKNQDFVTLAVSEDTDVKQVQNYVKKNNFGFRVLLDPRNDVGESYGVNGLPESFVIGRDGRIVAHHIGPYDWANPDIREALQDLLKAKQG